MIYTDVASIHNEILRRHPEIDPNRSSCYLDHSTSEDFAAVADASHCSDGAAVEVQHADEVEDYYGLQIRIVRWTESKGQQQ